MSILNTIKQAVNSLLPGKANPYAQTMEAAYQEFKQKKKYYWDTKANESEVFTTMIIPLSDKAKVAFIQTAVEQIALLNSNRISWSSEDKDVVLSALYENFMRHILKMRLVLHNEDIISILQHFINHRRHQHSKSLMHWPTAQLVSQVEKQLKTRPASPQLLQSLNALSTQLNNDRDYYEVKEKSRVIEKINLLIHNSTNEVGAVKPTWFTGSDEFADLANHYLPMQFSRFTLF